MARRRYRRYRRRTSKWAANLQEFNTTTQIAPANSSFWNSYVLAFNPTQVNTAVSQVFTVKRIEVNFYIDSAAGGDAAQSVDDVTVYIMFVPQGMQITQNYNLDHPEYIMAYKYLGGPAYDTNQTYQPTRVYSRLSRKLQSGDNVILFIKGTNTSNADRTFDIHGLVRWWTKAN